MMRWGNDQPETASDFWKALAVAVLLAVAGYAMVIAVAGTVA